jgi:hypothetical protein
MNPVDLACSPCLSVPRLGSRGGGVDNIGSSKVLTP